MLRWEYVLSSAQRVPAHAHLFTPLTPHATQVRFRFISFLNLLAKGDADGATHHLLRWAAKQTCRDPHALARDMRVLLASQGNIHSAAGIDLDAVLKATLRLARTHTVRAVVRNAPKGASSWTLIGHPCHHHSARQVSIDSNYAALVIGVCVLVGFATSLDPEVNLMDAAAPCLFAYNLTGRVLGRLYG